MCKKVIFTQIGCDIHGRATAGRIHFKGYVRESALTSVTTRFNMPVEEFLEQIEEGKLIVQQDGAPQLALPQIPNPLFSQPFPQPVYHPWQVFLSHTQSVRMPVATHFSDAQQQPNQGSCNHFFCEGGI